MVGWHFLVAGGFSDFKIMSIRCALWLAVGLKDKSTCRAALNQKRPVLLHVKLPQCQNKANYFMLWTIIYRISYCLAKFTLLHMPWVLRWMFTVQMCGEFMKQHCYNDNPVHPVHFLILKSSKLSQVYVPKVIKIKATYFCLGLFVVFAESSQRWLSAGAGLPKSVAPTLLSGGEGPWSEGFTLLSSDDILKIERKQLSMSASKNKSIFKK